MKKWSPDFNRFRAAVTRNGTPDRIPLAEVGIDIEVIEAYLGRPVDGIKTYIGFFKEAGYDYTLLQVRGQPIPDTFQVKIEEHELLLHGPENSVSSHSSARINDERTFNEYPWIGPENVYYRDVDRARDYLPDGMKLVVNHGPIFQSLFRMMGIENLSIATVENPALIHSIAKKVGESSINIVENLVQRDWVGAIWYGDDMAYTTGLLASPDFLREYVFPYLKRIGDVCRKYDKPLLMHSDGKLCEILEDIIACGVQGIHPNEPTSVDIFEMKRLWGDRLSLLGGIDLDLLTRGTPGQVVDLTKSMIDRFMDIGPQGIALGSSNSVAKYISLDNYRAMLDTVRKYGRIS
ncbi:MAG: uroporphyrinogen decarboxylase family protein [Victivallales bacterium]